MRKSILLTLFYLAGLELSAADFDVEALPENLVAPVQEFLKADTGKARGQMARFSDEDLQKITNSFKKGHDASEQRLFWLSEELYRRNAERVAAERIRYLYYAVLAALGIIAAFSAATYARARRLTPQPPLHGYGEGEKDRISAKGKSVSASLSTSWRGAGGEVKPKRKSRK